MKRFVRAISIALAFCGIGLSTTIELSSATTITTPANTINGLSTSFYALGSTPGTVSNATTLTQSMTPTATFFTTTPSYSVLASNPFTGAAGSLPLMSFVGSNGFGCSGNCSSTTFNSFFTMTGYYYAPTPETVNFELSSDDGSILTISGQTIINDDGDHSMMPPVIQAVTFDQAGYYALTLDYFQDAGGEGLALWDDPTGGTNFAPVSSASFVTDPSTPEPASFLLMGSALIAAFFALRRRSKV